eukprot:m.911539 g.911539  ORF g.911539 m.911539 type:complete len:401 (+) comp23725_c0_seq5:302-1504(+)
MDNLVSWSNLPEIPLRVIVAFLECDEHSLGVARMVCLRWRREIDSHRSRLTMKKKINLLDCISFICRHPRLTHLGLADTSNTSEALQILIPEYFATSNSKRFSCLDLRYTNTTKDVLTSIRRTPMLQHCKVMLQGAWRAVSPGPEITPFEVVEYQLYALKEFVDESHWSAIEKCFEFASPSNRRFTGPLESFADMVSSSYPQLIGWDSVEISEAREISQRMSAADDEQRVNVFTVRITRNGAVFPHDFYWIVTRENGGPMHDCWMTGSAKSQGTLRAVLALGYTGSTTRMAMRTVISWKASFHCLDPAFFFFFHEFFVDAAPLLFAQRCAVVFLLDDFPDERFLAAFLAAFLYPPALRSARNLLERVASLSWLLTMDTLLAVVSRPCCATATFFHLRRLL